MLYTQDKKERITLRLNQKQFDYVKTSADFLGVSPSEYLRMLVNLTMSTDEAVKKKAEEFRKENPAPEIKSFNDVLIENEEELRRENEKPDIDDIV